MADGHRPGRRPDRGWVHVHPLPRSHSQISMKRWAILTTLIAFGLFVLLLSEKRQADVEVVPRSMLNFLADGFREFAHVPAAAISLSDRQEIRIGDEMAQQYTTQKPWSREHSAQQARIEAYVQTVGMRVAGRAVRKL